MTNLGLINKNEGNLKDPKTGKLRVFSTPEESHQALIKDLEYKKSGQSVHIKPGQSIEQFGNAWAPPSDNNIPGAWAKNVAKYLGVDTAYAWDKVPTDEFAKGVAVAEGTTGLQSGQQKTESSPLVQKVRAKHPEYADLSDSDLEAKILKKYPEYADLASPGHNKDEATYQSQHTGALGTKPDDSTLGKVVDNSITHAAGGLVNNFIKPFVDVAAIPMQAGIAGINKLTGSNVPDPYQNIKSLGGNIDINKVENIGGKLSSAGSVAGDIGMVAAVGSGLGLLSKVFSSGSALANPLLEEALPISMKKFAQMSMSQQESVLNQGLKYALENPNGAGHVRLLTQAIKEIGPLVDKELGLVPTLARKVLNKSGGLLWKTGKLGLRAALDVAGIKGVNYLGK